MSSTLDHGGGSERVRPAVVAQSGAQWVRAHDIPYGTCWLHRSRGGRTVCGAPHELADRLPQGYATELPRLFEGGVDLSGGAWQTVGLARSVVRDAAHVPTPMTGMGFSAAPDDAEAIAASIGAGADGSSVAAALRAYEQQRLSSARRLVHAGQQFSRGFAREAA